MGKAVSLFKKPDNNLLAVEETPNTEHCAKVKKSALEIEVNHQIGPLRMFFTWVFETPFNPVAVIIL